VSDVGISIFTGFRNVVTAALGVADSTAVIEKAGSPVLRIVDGRNVKTVSVSKAPDGSVTVAESVAATGIRA
jgi:hypothetical protein